MAEVSVTINARQFRMACEDGQEDHLLQLARELDARIEGLRAKFGEIGDTRLMVMAALTIADELGEMALRFKRLQQELAGLKDVSVAAALTAAAERIENVTRRLNQTIGSGSVALG